MFEFLDLFKNQTKPCVAIDLSAASVKLLQLTPKDNTWHVETYGHAHIPPGIMEGASIQDKAELGKIIKKLCETLSLHDMSAALAVPDSLVVSKVIQVSESLSELEIEELITIEAENYIPYPIEEVNYDFRILGPSEKKIGLLDVLLVAIRKEYIVSRQEVLAAANLDAKLVDVESYMFGRVLPLLLKEASEATTELVAMMDIGAMYIRQYVFEGSKLVFAREEEFGGKRLIEMAMSQYQLTEEAWAEMVKTNTLPENYEKTVLTPFLQMVTTQVKREVDFFFSVSHDTEVKELLLSGGVAVLPGLTPLIQEAVSLPVKIANPFETATFAPHLDKAALLKVAPAWVGAFGLAMRNGI